LKNLENKKKKKKKKKKKNCTNNSSKWLLLQSDSSPGKWQEGWVKDLDEKITLLLSLRCQQSRVKKNWRES